jgi:hypothetical protein
VTSIKTDTKPIDGVSFSGLYKNREKTNNDDLSTVVASLSISPVKSLELIGNYETNPEDKNKNVNQITRRLVGVKTSMGSLSLTGKYGSTEDLLSGQLAQTREYGVELKLWSSTKFSAGLTQDDPMIGFTQNTYTMRFERNLGSDFSLSLEGKMIASDSTSQEKDITAGAKLGMKF